MTKLNFIFLYTEPTKRELLDDVAAVIPAKWYGFGEQLDIKTGILKGFELENRGDCSKCFSDVFDKWMSSKTRTPISWATVINVLKSPSIDEQRLAEDIIKKHKLNL